MPAISLASCSRLRSLTAMAALSAFCCMTTISAAKTTTNAEIVAMISCWAIGRRAKLANMAPP